MPRTLVNQWLRVFFILFKNLRFFRGLTPLKMTKTNGGENECIYSLILTNVSNYFINLLWSISMIIHKEQFSFLSFMFWYRISTNKR